MPAVSRRWPLTASGFALQEEQRVILDNSHLGSGSTASGDSRENKPSRFRKWGLGLGFVLMAVGLKSTAVVPSVMHAAIPAFLSGAPAQTVKPLDAQLLTVDANGVKYFSLTSVYQGERPLTVRVLEPTHPAPGRSRRLLYVLPVEVGVTTRDSKFGDGFEELRTLNAQNRFNMTLIAPSFEYEPWYGDSDTDRTHSMETFIVRDLVPWGDTFLPKGTAPQRLLVGLSKSGHGALSLLFRHPDVFAAAAAWDAPAQLKDIGAFNALRPNFGSQENFDRYYIPALVASDVNTFQGQNRLWISGDPSIFTEDMKELHAQLTSAGIQHTWVVGGYRAHIWGSGWLEGAATGLDAIATQLGPHPAKKQRLGAEDSKRPQVSSNRRFSQTSATR